MKKGSILYIGFFNLPDKDAAACRVMNNAKLIRSLGYDVIFIDEQINYPFNSIYESKRTINGFTIYSLERPNDIKTFISKMFSINRIKSILEMHNEIKMIIAYNYPAIALYNLKRVIKKKIKICSDCTEWYSGKEYIFPLNILSKIDSFVRMRIIHPKLDGIICISSYLENYYKNKTKTVKIPPLVDIEEDIWHQNKINFDSEKINLVYGGNPGRCKDLIKPIVYAINKCENSKNIILRIVGVTKEQYLNMNPEDSKYIESNIRFLGRVSHAENVRIVGSSDYLIFIREKNRVSMAGFSTKFVEAITSDTAIITTDTSDIKKYMNKVNNGVVVENINDLNNIILQISESFINSPKLSSKENMIKPCNIFDYKNYILDFKKWLEIIICID